MKTIMLLASTAIFATSVPAQEKGKSPEAPPRAERARKPARGGFRFGLDAKALAGLMAKYDKNGDGKIERKEYPRSDAGFANLDRDGNGRIEKADLEASRRRGPGGRRNRGKGDAARPRPPELPMTGEVAPDFELPMLGMKGKKVKLSSFAGDRPVALIFGSYT